MTKQELRQYVIAYLAVIFIIFFIIQDSYPNTKIAIFTILPSLGLIILPIIFIYRILKSLYVTTKEYKKITNNDKELKYESLFDNIMEKTYTSLPNKSYYFYLIGAINAGIATIFMPTLILKILSIIISIIGIILFYKALKKQYSNIN